MKLFAYIANACSIIGTIIGIIGCFGDKTWGPYVIIGALIICIIVFIILYNLNLRNVIAQHNNDQKQLLNKIDTILEGTSTDTDHDGFEIKTVFLRFEQQTKDTSFLDNYKVIQSKRLFLNEVNHEFMWSGRNTPNIKSSLQDVGEIKLASDKKAYSSVPLKFKTPLQFNATTTVHVHQDMNDTSSAEPYLCYKVREDQRISLIIFNVVLKHKKNNTATLSKMRINNIGVPEEFEIMDSLKFDSISKSYFYELVDPIPGYYYKLQWEK